jgi:hypothetical protein
MHIFEYDELSNIDKNKKYLPKFSTNIFNLFDVFLFYMKLLLCSRNFKNVIASSILAKIFFSFLNYRNYLKNYLNIKLAIIDYDVLCPKALLLSLKSLKITTVSVQERFNLSLNKNYSVNFDYYFANKFSIKYLLNNKLNKVNNYIPLNFYRADWLSKLSVPKEIFYALKNKKKIIISLGYHSNLDYSSATLSPILNWKAQKSFIYNMINISKRLNNSFVVIRYKDIDFLKNNYFDDVIKIIDKRENIIISKIYNEDKYSYKLCSYADLIVAKHTSLADECICKNIPVLFHDFTHNFNGITKKNFDFLYKDLICTNEEDLLNKANLFLNKNKFFIKKFQKINSKLSMNNINISAKEYIHRHVQKIYNSLL